jgi:outer membrane protein assembly factor BamB
MLNKKSLFALTLAIILTVPMMMQLGQVSGKTTINVPDYLYVNAAPNPIGVDQTTYISLFFSKPIPQLNSTSFFLAATEYTDITINVVKPDGTNETLGPYTSDTSGGVAAVAFVPTVTGNYTLQGVFPGQSLGTSSTGVTYNMDPDLSPAVKLVVQQAAVSTYSSPSLPTSYWTTPIYASNYGWAQTIGGNWYGLGRPGFDNTGGYDATGNNYQPYSTAPTTAHILWTKSITTGGQPGGETSANEMSAFAASSPLYHTFEPIILDGVLYYNWYPAQTDMAGIAAVDLFTGQTEWVKSTSDTLMYGQVITFHTVEEFGSQAMLWAYNPDGNYDILDPVTGNTMATVDNVPYLAYGFASSSPALIDSNEPNCIGSILIYYMNSTYSPTYTATASSLTMWNSSLCLTGPFAVGGMAEIYTGDFKPSGTYNFKTGIEWSVPIPAADTNFSIAGESMQGILLTSYPQVLSTYGNQFGGSSATDIAYSPINGTVLWGPTTQTMTKFDDTSIIAVGDGVYVRQDKDTNQLYGYSLTTGKQMWGPTQLVGNALSHLYSSAAIAYGQVYVWDIGGYVNAVNVTTGKLDWTYTRGSAGYNTPYGVYPIWVFGTQSIADGMLFLAEGRCYDPPLFPGGEKLAINCTTGKLVWEINGAFQRDVSPIADSELLGWNGYDGQIYAFGRGPSKTTVTAPDVGVTTATPVTITGTVMDVSPGSQQTAVAADFPNGLPCVSDASMTQFMEAVYEQQPMPTNVTGVPVTLSVTDSNHNTYVIGTTTTDASGTYSLTWTPIITGNFTVTATFAGTQSYYGSSAETHFYASAPAPTASPYPSPVSGLASTGSLELGIAAVIIVIVIIGIVLAILTVRKRP